MVKHSRWSDLRHAFDSVVDLDDVRRRAYLAALAKSDPELHTELAALLQADLQADTLLSRLEPAAATEVSPADPFALVGTSVSHFQVLAVLGSGGMGVVYRATDVRLGRSVALKFLLPQYSSDASARDRFLQEARAASALDHPNVCTVYEVGDADSGRIFMAMAHYAGETLRERLLRSPRPGVQEAVDMARQTLRGLSAAHRAGIVHRDLKPANLLLADDGTVRILDFGLARLRDEIDVTTPGLPPGTVAYMSPEQIEGGAVDARTDLWALGIVLHEMLTGAIPFRRGHELSTVHSILNDIPAPPSRLDTAVPRWLDDVVLRLLAKDPDRRYASADEVIADLGRSRAPLHPGTRRRRALAAGLLAVLAVSTAVAAARVLGRNGDAAVNAVQNSIAVLPFADVGASDGQTWFGDGISEEILDVLNGVRDLHVTSRRSAFSFRDPDLAASDIARRLNVATLLGGTIRRDGDSVRISAWLVDGRTNRELWSRSFDVPRSQLVRVQTEIARAVAATLLPDGAAAGIAMPRTVSESAHEAYLLGLFHWHRRTPADVRAARDYFEDATRIDSTYARAHAGLALAYAVQPILTGLPASEFVLLTEAAAARAFRLDPTLADAHAALGYIYHQQWRWADAERAFLRALELNPGHVSALQWYAEHAAKLGHDDDALRLVRRAVALDPLSTIAHHNLGLVLWLTGRPDEAIVQLESTARMDPGFAIVHLLLYRAQLADHRFDDAIASGRTFAELSGQFNAEDVETVIRAATDSTLRADALSILDRWNAAPARAIDVALGALMLGDNERAIRTLEQAVEQRNPFATALRAYWIAPIAGDPRMQALIRRMDFPE
jgi:eukaryotic-like serine/threonine-protein kinase